MGWASGMQAGTAMARNWIDTYRSADEARRIKKVMEDTPQEVQSFDQKAVSGIAKDQAAGNTVVAKPDENGRPLYYSLPKATPGQMEQFTSDLVLSPQEAFDASATGQLPAGPDLAPRRGMPLTGSGVFARAQEPTEPQPKVYSPRTQYKYGDKLYDEKPSEAMLRLEQQRRIGLEMQRYNPAEGLRLQNDAARAMREEELHPLALRAQNQQIESTDYTLRDQQRTEESTIRVNSFMDALSQPELQGRPLKELMEIGAKDYGLNLKELNGIIETKKGFSQGTLDAVAADLKLRTRDLDLPGLLKFH
ncbi:MAG: hypothetical protein ABFE07_27180, partial [Armatimonadia bacterium]